MSIEERIELTAGEMGIELSEKTMEMILAVMDLDDADRNNFLDIVNFLNIVDKARACS